MNCERNVALGLGSVVSAGLFIIAPQQFIIYLFSALYSINWYQVGEITQSTKCYLLSTRNNLLECFRSVEICLSGLNNLERIKIESSFC